MNDINTYVRTLDHLINEKTLTPAELKKREEVAKAIERENPDMPMSKKMAIATATAKKVAETVEQQDSDLDEASVPSMSHAAIMKKINSGTHEAMSDVKPGKHVELRHTATGKRMTVHVKEGFADDFLAMAREKKPQARMVTGDQKKKEGEELAKKRAGLKPVHASPSSNPRPLGGYDPKSGRSYSEEVESIDELKKSTLGSYVKKASKEVADNAWKAGTAEHPDLLQRGKLRAKAFFKAKRRMAGIDKATDRLAKEEVDSEGVELEEEQLDELSKSTLASYIKKRSHDVAAQAAMTRQGWHDAEKARDAGDRAQQRKSQASSDKAFAKGLQHRKNIAKAVDRLTKEEFEIDEELDFKKEAAKHMKDMHDKNATPANKAYAQKMLQRALEASKMKDKVAATKHYMGEEVSEQKSSLPPHLQKLIKDKQLDKKPMTMVTPSQKEKLKATVKDVTPKGYGPNEEVELDEADLTKINTKTLTHLAALHRRYADKNPDSKKAAEAGEAELKRRQQKEEVEIDEGVTVLSARPTTHAEHEYSTSAGTHPASHVEKTLGLKSGSISKDKKTYIKHGDVHVRTTPVGKHVQVSLVRKHGKFGQDTSKHDEQRESLRSKLLKKNEEVELEELRNVTQDQLGGRMGSSGPGFNKTPAGKAREVQRKQEHLKGQMRFTKSQGGIAGPKGKLPEEVELDEAKIGDTVSFHYQLQSAPGSKVKKSGTVEKVEDGVVHVKVKDKYGVKRHQVKMGDLVKEEVELDEAVKEGDFVKDPRGNVHRVFKVVGNMLHVGQYRGKGAYGGTDMLHKTKATKVAKPEGVTEELELDENYRTLALKGIGAEGKGDIKVGHGVDYYHPKTGDKHMGKIVSMSDKGYVVKDDKTGDKHSFDYFRREQVEFSEAARPGWMLRADSKLANKLKQKLELVRKRQQAYGNPSAGKSVKENVDPDKI